jgi:hypothetical protein
MATPSLRNYRFDLDVTGGGIHVGILLVLSILDIALAVWVIRSLARRRRSRPRRCATLGRW